MRRISWGLSLEHVPQHVCRRRVNYNRTPSKSKMASAAKHVALSDAGYEHVLIWAGAAEDLLADFGASLGARVPPRSSSSGGGAGSGRGRRPRLKGLFVSVCVETTTKNTNALTRIRLKCQI